MYMRTKAIVVCPMYGENMEHNTKEMSAVSVFVYDKLK